MEVDKVIETTINVQKTPGGTSSKNLRVLTELKDFYIFQDYV